MAESMVIDPIWRILEFQGRTITWLSGKTIGKKKESTVRSYRDGRSRPSREFRQKCEDVLGIPEDILFKDGADADDGDGA